MIEEPKPGYVHAGNKSCAVAVTPSTAAPVEGIDVLPDDTATQQKPPPSDNTEEERHSFALSKDGAKIIASNKEAKKASAILDTDSDTYMKNECKADKWFIIELSQVIFTLRHTESVQAKLHACKVMLVMYCILCFLCSQKSQSASLHGTATQKTHYPWQAARW